MDVLWRSETPMTASDIVVASPERTWQEVSIHVILKTLQAKNAVAVDRYVPTTGRTAKAFIATVTTAQYIVSHFRELNVSTPDLLRAIAENVDKEKCSNSLDKIDWANN